MSPKKWWLWSAPRSENSNERRKEIYTVAFHNPLGGSKFYNYVLYKTFIRNRILESLRSVFSRKLSFTKIAKRPQNNLRQRGMNMHRLYDVHHSAAFDSHCINDFLNKNGCKRSNNMSS